MAKCFSRFFSKTFQGAVATLPFSFCGCKITASARHGQMFSQVFFKKNYSIFSKLLKNKTIANVKFCNHNEAGLAQRHSHTDHIVFLDYKQQKGHKGWRTRDSHTELTDYTYY